MKTFILPIGLGILVLFLAILAIYLERAWRHYQQQRAESTTENSSSLEKTLTNLRDNIPDLSTTMKGMLQQKGQTANLVEPFRAWVSSDLKHQPELYNWLLSLPEYGFELLTIHIAEFCQEMNMDLKWLVERHVDVAPELRKAIQDSIIDYCYACQKAVAVQNHAHIFAHYYNLVSTTQESKSSGIQQTLFAQLADQGLVTAPSASELINANDAERQQQAIRSIQQAAAKDWTQFANILQHTATYPNGNGSTANGSTANGSNGIKKI